MKATSIILSLCLLATACTTSPTGRKQVMLFSPNQLNEMGAKSFDELKQKEKLSTDKNTIAYVHCIADNITKNVPESVHQGDWEVVVFVSEQVNAFALPGGKIGVYTGLISLADDQAQLAAVIGHEVGHVIAQHSNERLSQNAGAQILLQGTDAVLTASGNEYKNLILTGESLLIQFGFLLPYGRTHEKEADIIGQELMARSGFDPKASVSLWQNMAKQDKKVPPEWMSTHPSSETRISKLTKHLAVSQPLYSKSKQRPNCRKP